MYTHIIAKYRTHIEIYSMVLSYCTLAQYDLQWTLYTKPPNVVTLQYSTLMRR